MGTARYIARRFMRTKPNEQTLTLLGIEWNGEDEELAAQAIAVWLGTNYVPMPSPIGGFLEKLDAFNISDFIRAIKFDEMKVPTAPLQLPLRKTYTGLDQMMESELDYLKYTVLSKSTEDVIMFSDMPMEEMAADPEFPKKWMYGMAMLLKKGLHLHMIHSTGRPLPEMMLGLESWIPMYMTGQISPYYLEDMHNDVFLHLLKTSGTVALAGEAIAGHQAEGRYVLTKNREDVRYFRQRAGHLLQKARPLMRIVTAQNAYELNAFHTQTAQSDEDKRFIMSTLPLGSIPLDLLERILTKNQVSEAERATIVKHAKQQGERLRAMLQLCKTQFEVPRLSPHEFETHSPELELTGIFHAKAGIPYTYEEYGEHFKALRALLEQYPQARLVVDANSPFRNIQIAVGKGRWALVSKNREPVIHFIIENPEMVAAFERFTAPVTG